MNKKGRKKLQKQYSKDAMNLYFSLLESGKFLKEYEQEYVKQIISLQTSFTIPLSQYQKYKLCKKCHSYLNAQSVKIRFNSKLRTKEFICSNCGHRRRIPYK
ncbi:MAG: hypothetical protein ACLFPL_03710 [Candidatus Nanoarchaeia archaeon]